MAQYAAALAKSLNRQHGLCFYCDRRMVPPAERGWKNRDLDATLDHKIPKHMGGRSWKGNGVASCSRCNNDKGPLTHIVYLMVRDTPVLLREVRRLVCMEIEKTAGDRRRARREYFEGTWQGYAHRQRGQQFETALQLALEKAVFKV